MSQVNVDMFSLITLLRQTWFPGRLPLGFELADNNCEYSFEVDTLVVSRITLNGIFVGFKYQSQAD